MWESRRPNLGMVKKKEKKIHGIRKKKLNLEFTNSKTTIRDFPSQFSSFFWFFFFQKFHHIVGAFSQLKINKNRNKIEPWYP